MADDWLAEMARAAELLEALMAALATAPYAVRGPVVGEIIARLVVLLESPRHDDPREGPGWRAF